MAFLRIICFLLLIDVLCTKAKISDKRLCADPECSVQISYAKVILRYIGSDPRRLSLKVGDTVKVFSKEAGILKDIWGVEVNGVRGYAPRDFMREYKVLVPSKDLKHIVPTEDVEPMAPSFLPGVSGDSASESSLSKDGVTSPIEVIDGTTIFLSPDGEVAGSKVIQATAVNANVQPSSVSQQASSEPPASGEDQLKQDSSTIEPSEPPTPASEPETTTESNFSNEMTSETLEPDGGDELEEEGSGEEEDEEEDEEDDYEDEEEEEDASQAPDGSSEMNMPPTNLSSVDLDSSEKPGVNETPLHIDQSDSSVNNTENELNQTVSGEDNEVESNVSNISDPVLDASQPQATEQNTRIPPLDVKSSPPPPLVLQRFPEVSTLFSDHEKKVPNNEEVHDESGAKEEAVLDSSTINPDVEDEATQPKDEASDIEHDSALQQESERPVKEEESTAGEPLSQQRNTGDVDPEGQSLNQTESDKEDQIGEPSLEDLDSSKEDEDPHTSGEQVDERREENHVESDGQVTERTEDTFQANTTQNEDQQSPEVFQDNVGLNTAEDEHQPVKGKPEEIVSEPEKEETEENMEKLGQTLGGEISEGDVIHVEDNFQNKGNDLEMPLGSENLNLSTEYVSDFSNQQVPPPIIFDQDDIREHVTTESASDQLLDSPRNVEDEVTQAYPVSQETASAEGTTESTPEEGEVSPSVSDSSTEYNAEDTLDPVVSDSSGDYVSGMISLAFSAYERIFDLVLGPRQQDGDDTSEIPSSGEDIEAHEGHMEGDHLVNILNEEPAAAAVCDSECEARKLGPDPAVDYSQPSITEESPQYEPSRMEEEKDFPSYSLPFFGVTAVTVLFFTLGYYYLEKKQRDGILLAKINKLEKALLASAKEKTNLQVDLEEMTEKLCTMSDSSCPIDIRASLEAQLEEAKAARIDLEEQVASLERELDTATETGLELNRMLSEFLSAQHGSDSLMKSVEHLQKQLDNQQGTINTMNSSLSAKSMENESLQADLNLAEERIRALEEEVQKVSQSLQIVEKEKQEIEHELQQKSKSIETELVEALEGKSAETQRLGRELETLQEVLDETRRTLASRDSELEVLRDCLRKVDGESGDSADKKLLELADVGRARAELALVTRERDSLQERLQGEEEARKLLEDHVRIVSEEVDSLRTKYREADHAKVEAQTRLEVLSTYFKEKETQLQKELGLQEAMYIQKEGDAMSTIERIKSLQEEVESYKSQNETLKKEILDQERGLKAQIATLEKKAHENWVVARQAERRLEETKQENGQLRNRLTLVERNHHNTSDVPKLNERHPIESNGEHPTSPLPLVGLGDLQDLPGSPLHYGHPASPPLLPGQTMPPPPIPFPPLFLPPPPHTLPFLPPLPPGDRRPPPLGRMSSPPPSPYDHSPPPSPPGRSYRSPPPRYDDSPERDRYRHRNTPPHRTPPPPFPPYQGPWDDHHGPPRSSFRPLRRESPREPKGSTLSSGHSSESIDKSSRHSGRV